MNQFRKYLYLSQATLFVGLVICTAIMPSIAARNGGVSNYGNYLITFPLYTLAFGLNGLFFYLAAIAIPDAKTQSQFLVRALKVLSVSTFIVLLSTFPRHFSNVYSDIHDDLGIVLYGFYFLLSIWIVVKRRTHTTLLLLFVETVGSLIGLLSALKLIQLLFVGQMIGAVAFGLLLCVSLPSIVAERSR